jgi:hypothetical protein
VRGISVPPKAGETDVQATFFVLAHYTVNMSERSVYAEFLPYEDAATAANHGKPVGGVLQKSLFSRRPDLFRQHRAAKTYTFESFTPLFDPDGDIPGQILARGSENPTMKGGSVVTTDSAGNIVPAGNTTV